MSTSRAPDVADPAASAAVRALPRASAHGLIVTNTAGRVAFLDPGAEHMLGAATNIWAGRSITDLSANEPSTLALTEAVEALSRGDRWDGAVVLRGCADDKRSVVLTAASVADTDGTVLSWVWTLGDIPRQYAGRSAYGADEQDRLASELADAMHRDEISLHYQPIVELAHGELTGVEALLRWDHPRRGAIGPTEFVEAAERAGLIAELDGYALRHACADAARLRAIGVLGSGGYVSVNLSAATLATGDVAAVIADALAQAVLPARNLMVEMKEAGLLGTAGAADAFASVQRLGVAVSVDAFGAGGATLAELARYTLATLKIDRSFVRTIDDSPDALTVVASAIELARGLGARTVAMGVETSRQSTVLRRMGCHAGQGYLWSEAVPLPRLVAALRKSAGGTPTWADPATERRDEVTAAHGLLRMLALQPTGASTASIASALNRDGFRTPHGQRWHARTVEATLRQMERFSLPV